MDLQRIYQRLNFSMDEIGRWAVRKHSNQWNMVTQLAAEIGTQDLEPAAQYTEQPVGDNYHTLFPSPNLRKSLIHLCIHRNILHSSHNTAQSQECLIHQLAKEFTGDITDKSFLHWQQCQAQLYSVYSQLFRDYWLFPSVHIYTLYDTAVQSFEQYVEIIKHAILYHYKCIHRRLLQSCM